jgi:endonuclease YncB( thermonuclease family)
MDWDNIFCEALCVDVHDGDTVTLKIDMRVLLKKYYPNDLEIVGKLPEKFVCLSCRLQGYNCAELNSKDVAEKEQALADRNFVRKNMLGKTVQCDLGKTDTYGRILTHIYVNNLCFNDIMLNIGHSPCQNRRKGFSYVDYSNITFTIW